MTKAQIEALLSGQIKSPTMQVENLNYPSLEMSPKMKLRWEGYTHPDIRFPTGSEVYAVSPKTFPEIKGSKGIYIPAGPYRNKIFINVDETPRGQIGEVLRHELRHRETGGMGGFTIGRRF